MPIEDVLRRRIGELETENEALLQRVEMLEAALAPPDAPTPYDLTRQQRKIYLALAKHGRASVAHLRLAARNGIIDADAPGENALRVVICNMRKRGVPIQAVFGWGYELTSAPANV